MSYLNKASVQKTLSVLILAAVLGMAGSAGYLIREYLEANHIQIESLNQDLSRLRQIAGFQDHIDDYRELSESEQVRRVFVATTGSARSLAEFQNMVKNLAGASGVRIGSVIEVPTVDENEIRWLGLRLRITGQTAAVHQFVRRIESNIPFIFVRRANLVGDRNPTRATTPNAMLQLDIEVAGAVKALQEGPS